MERIRSLGTSLRRLSTTTTALVSLGTLPFAFMSMSRFRNARTCLIVSSYVSGRVAKNPG